MKQDDEGAGDRSTGKRVKRPKVGVEERRMMGERGEEEERQKGEEGEAG